MSYLLTLYVRGGGGLGEGHTPTAPCLPGGGHEVTHEGGLNVQPPRFPYHFVVPISDRTMVSGLMWHKHYTYAHRPSAGRAFLQVILNVYLSWETCRYLRLFSLPFTTELSVPFVYHLGSIYSRSVHVGISLWQTLPRVGDITCYTPLWRMCPCYESKDGIKFPQILT